jgi:cytochrome c-type biogenesis protein CcmH/NrfG
LGKAAALNDGYEWGGVETAWGRFFGKLPWPKRDRKQAEEHLRRALQLNPAALRARVYLGVTFLDDDRAAEAKRLLDEVAAAPVGRYDAPEERRAKAMAAGLQPELAAKLR